MQNSVFRALADPTRRKILRLLRDGDLNAGGIGSHFDMRGASISHHLSVLHHADLVQQTRDGQHLIYSLNTTVFRDLLEWILDLKGGDEYGGDEHE